MKKLVLVVLLFVSLFWFVDFVSATWCDFNTWWNIQSSLKWCLSDTALVNPNGDVKLESWVINKVNNITKIIATILSLWAILWIIYGSFLMVVSAWEDEKIKKAKDVIKWSILWFLWVVLASSLIALTINLIYSLGKK